MGSGASSTRSRKKGAAKGKTAHGRSPSREPDAGAIQVRPAAAADAPAIAVLWNTLNQLHAPFGEEWSISEGAAERYARGVASAAANPRLRYLVAEEKGKIVGFIQCGVKLRNPALRDSVAGEIPALCVASAAAGKGVGSRLVAAALQWLRERGVPGVETTVATPNGPARAFWKAVGFRESAVALWAEVPPGTGAELAPGAAPPDLR